MTKKDRAGFDPGYSVNRGCLASVSSAEKLLKDNMTV